MELLPDVEESEGEVVGFQAEVEAEQVEELGLLLPWPIQVCVNWKHASGFKGHLFARRRRMCEVS